MKTSYYLATAAVLAAAGAAAYSGLAASAPPLPAPAVSLAVPAAALQSPADGPALPPVVLGPGANVRVVVSEPPKVAALPAPVIPVAPPLVGDITPAHAEEIRPQVVTPVSTPLVPPVTLPPVPSPFEVPPPTPTPVVPKPVPLVPPLTPPPPAMPSPSPLPLVPPPTLGGVNPAPQPPQLLPVPDAPLPAPTPLVSPALPSVGSVVVLSDGKLVEGTVTKSGDKVLVRKGAIDQPYTKEQVQFIGKSKDDVYRYMLGKVKPDDAPGRFKLARWCMYNGLREQALAEAREVVRLQPNNTAAAEMARSLDESLRLFPADGAAPKPGAPAAPGLPTVPPPAGFGKPAAGAVDEPEMALTPEAAVAFGPRVQPILANQCAECHAKPGYAGPFKLANTTGVALDPAVTRLNLRTVAVQVKKNDPASSPLLLRSLVAHGGMKLPAFTDRQATAYRVLEAWVFAAAGSPSSPIPTGNSAPTLPPPPAPPTPARVDGAGPAPVPPLPPVETTPVLPPVPPPAAATPPPIPPALEAVKSVPPGAGSGRRVPPIPPAAEVKFGQDAKPLPVTTAPNPANAGEALDEFDPSVFNRAVQARPPAADAPPRKP